MSKAPSGSSRAKLMLALAQSGGGGKKAGGATPASLVTFSRKQQQQQQKRDAQEGAFVFGEQQGTPKKQRISPLAGAGPSAPRPPPPLGPAEPAAARPALRDTTCTQQLTCYSNKQRLREQHQQAEQERQQSAQWRLGHRRALSSGGGAGVAFRRGGSGGGRSAAGLSRLPAGMRNLGNTCYMNAVLQALLSLPCFVADLRRGWRVLEGEGQPLGTGGIYAALLDCVAARDSSLVSAINPAAVKRALDAASATFQGALQQDAHELFVELLDGVQREVLARECARLGRSRVRISETADPAARSFSFAVQHELECRGCRHTSRMVEEYMHLSLELPEAQPGSVAASSIPALLREYFKEEEVEKTCEGCGGVNLPHSLRHCIRRLPRVLVLHMKRFKVNWSAAQQQAVCQKLHTQVAIPEAVQLGSFLAAGAGPPLPGAQQQGSAGKENEQSGANASGPGGEAGGHGGPPKGPHLRQQKGSSFYGAASGGGLGGLATPSASHALLSPLGGGLFKSPALRGRQATPAAAFDPASLADEDDAALQQALAASLLEQGPPEAQQQVQQAGQQPPAAAPFALGRHGAEEEEVEVALIRAASPCSASAALLPPELESAAQAASAARGADAGDGSGSRRPEQPWWREGLASSAGEHGGKGRLGGGGLTAAEREEAELQQVMELSRMEHEQQQAAQQAAAEEAAAGQGPGAAAAPSRAEQEEEDLRRAIEQSMLEQGSAAGSARAGQAQHARQHQQQQQQQQHLGGLGELLGMLRGDAAGADAPGSSEQHPAESPGREQAAAGAGMAAADGGTPLAAAALAGMQQCGQAPGAGQAPAAGQVMAGLPLPAYLQARIVEDDDPLLLAEEQERQGHGQDPGHLQQAGGSRAAASAGASSCAAAGFGSPVGGGPAGGSKAACREAPKAKYRLQGLVDHKGLSASCGHFTSDIRDPASGQWHRLDDSLAARISLADACSPERQRECYLLFYVAA